VKIGWLLLLGCLLVALPARADERAAAKRLFSSGVELFEQGDHRAALAQFEQAYAAAPYPVVLYNIGLAHEALGDPVRAIAAFEKVLAAPGTLRKERVQRAQQSFAALSKSLGKLTVQSTTPGVSIRVNGEDWGAPPIERRAVKSGNAIVELYASGHRSERRGVTIPPAGEASIAADLTSAAALGQIKVSSPLEGADIVIDGAVVARTPHLATLALEAGTHRVELRRAGYATAGESLVLAAGSVAEVSLSPRVDLVALRTQSGTLRLAIEPPDSSFKIDGERIDSPPDAIRLPEGPHLVLIERSGFDPLELRVELQPGATLEKRVALLATPEQRARDSDARSLRRGGAIASATLGGALTVAGVSLLTWNVGEKGGLDQREADREARTGEFAGCGDLTRDGCWQKNLQLGKDRDLATGIDIGGSIGLAAGAAGVVTAVVLFATIPAGPQTKELAPDEWQLVPVIAPMANGGYLGVGGRF